jgi:hypothetical protein
MRAALVMALLASAVHAEQCVAQRASYVSASARYEGCFQSFYTQGLAEAGKACAAERLAEERADAELTISCSWSCAFAERVVASTRASLASSRARPSRYSDPEYWVRVLEQDLARRQTSCAPPWGHWPTVEQQALIRARRPLRLGTPCVAHSDYGYQTGTWAMDTQQTLVPADAGMVCAPRVVDGR